ncbi:MAG: DEAD/DEAH box helicase, partial [Firmicutes bacterium]|nr:DEAD/DEAH box helicase [Bacillota bacterium]
QEIAGLQKYDGTISIPLPIKATPYQHQIAAFNFALSTYNTSKGFALLADMGTGKTITSIAIMGRLYLDNKISRVLIAAPKSILPVWHTELAKFADFEYTIIQDLTSKKTQKQLSIISQSSNNNLQIVILNYESIWRQIDDFVNFKIDFVIADESSKIKTPNTKQSKAMHKLGKLSKYNIILSGTPITNSPLDIYSQYKFMDDSVFPENWWVFQKKYANLDYNNRITGFKNLGQLLARMHKVAYRVRLSSVVDMPQIVNLQRMVQFNPASKKQYNQLQKGLLTLLKSGTELQQTDNKVLDQIEFGDLIQSPLSNNTDSSPRFEISHDNLLVKFLKLAQFTGGFATDDNGTVLSTNTAKLDELNNILDEFIDKKIVIFARFRAEIEAIGNLLQSKNIQYSLIFGDTKDRQQQVEQFQNNDTVRVFVGQIATAGMGITLTAAHTTVYYSLDFSYANYEQSRSRTFRIGQKYPCTYIHLLVQNTIDELMYNALLNKQDVAKQLVDDYKKNI